MMPIEEIKEKLKEMPRMEDILTMAAIAEKYGEKDFIRIARAVVMSRIYNEDSMKLHDELRAMFGEIILMLP